jgi:hypothetical protein
MAKMAEMNTTSQQRAGSNLATTPGSVVKTPGGQVIIQNPVYGNVLDTEKYNSFVEQEQKRFNESVSNKKSELDSRAQQGVNESQANFEGRERFVQSLEAPERSFSRQRFGAEQGKQNAIVEQANTELNDFTNTEFSKSQKATEEAKNRFTKRAIIGYNTTTYTTTSENKVVKEAPNTNYGVKAPFANTEEGLKAQQSFEKKQAQDNQSFLETFRNIAVSKDTLPILNTNPNPKFVAGAPIGEKIISNTQDYSNLSGVQKLGLAVKDTVNNFGKVVKGAVDTPVSFVEGVRQETKDSVKPEFKNNALALGVASIPIALKNLTVMPAEVVTNTLRYGVQGVPGQVKEMVNSPEKIGGLVSTALIFRSAEGVSNKMLFGNGTLTKFGDVKSISREADGSITMQSVVRAKTDGLIGKKFEVTGNVKLTPLDVEKTFGGRGFTKIRGPVERVLLTDKAGTNFVRLEAGKKVLLLPEKIADTVIKKSETGLVLANAELAKFAGPKASFNAGRVSNLKESLGQPFIVKSEGVVRVRQLGVRERVQQYFNPEKNFVKDVERAQAKGISGKSVSESVEGVSFGKVQNREIIVKGNKIDSDFASGGFKQQVLDIRRLGNELKLNPEKVKQVFNPKNELWEYWGKAQTVKDFSKASKPSVSVTGTKGTVTNVEFKGMDKVSSGSRVFKTQEIKVGFEKGKTVTATRTKIEGYPMEFKNLEVKGTRVKSNLKTGEPIANKIKAPKEPELLKAPAREIKAPKETKLLPAPKNDLVPNNKVIDAKITKYEKSGLDKGLKDSLTNAGSTQVATKGVGVVQKMLFKNKTRFGGGLSIVNANAVLNSAKTLLINKTKTSTNSSGAKAKQVTPSVEKLSFKQKLLNNVNVGVNSRFAQFANTSSKQSERVNTQVRTRTLTFEDTAQKTNTVVIPSTSVTTRVNTSTAISQAQTATQLQNEVLRINTRQAQKVNFTTPTIPRPTNTFTFPNKKRRDIFDLKEKKKLRRVYNVVTRKAGRVQVIGRNLEFNQAIKRGKFVAENTARQSFGLRATGFTEVNADAPKQNLRGFRVPVKKSNLRKLGDVVFTQQRKFSIRSRGEKEELKRARRRVF